jgi:Mce-associated membrane protein
MTAASAALLVVSIALAISWLLVGKGGHHDDAVDRAQEKAVSAARVIAADINSYDYRTLDAQFGVVEQEITGALLENFGATKASVRSGFVSAEISSSAVILAAGSVSGTEHEGTVLVWLSVTTTTNGTSSVQQAPLRLHLVDRDSRWLADQIATVG